MISLISAIDDKWGIGKNNSIPWSNNYDMKFFKQMTYGSACIMGRNTFESLKKPLDNRLNIVVTSDYKNKINTSNVYYVNTIEDAIRLAKLMRFPIIFGIGGKRIYQKLSPFAQYIYLTLIPGDYQCDTHFPKEVMKKYTLTHFNSLEDNTKVLTNIRINHYG